MAMRKGVLPQRPSGDTPSPILAGGRIAATGTVFYHNQDMPGVSWLIPFGSEVRTRVVQ